MGGECRFRVAIILGLMLQANVLGQENREDIVALAVSKNTAAVQKIVLYYARVELKSLSGDINDVKRAEFWKWDRQMRHRETEGSITRDWMYEGSKTIMYLGGGDFDGPGPASGEEVGETNAWELSLFRLPSVLNGLSRMSPYSLKEAVEIGQVTEKGWASIQEQRLAHLRIEIPEQGRSYEVWLTPERNWLIQKVIHGFTEKTSQRRFEAEYEIDQFAEVAPSTFAPTRTLLTYRASAEPETKCVATLSDLRVNANFPPWPPPPNPLPGVRHMGVAEQLRVAGGPTESRPLRDPSESSSVFSLSGLLDFVLSLENGTSWVSKAVPVLAALFGIAGAYTYWKGRSAKS